MTQDQRLSNFDIRAKLSAIDQAHSEPSKATAQTQADVDNRIFGHPTSTSKIGVKEYIIIGHAYSEAYRNTVTAVHATIDDDDSLGAFTYSAYASRQMNIIDMDDVVYLPEYACLGADKHVDAVREAVLWHWMGRKVEDEMEKEEYESDEEDVFLTDGGGEDEDKDEQRSQIVDM